MEKANWRECVSINCGFEDVMHSGDPAGNSGVNGSVNDRERGGEACLRQKLVTRFRNSDRCSTLSTKSLHYIQTSVQLLTLGWLGCLFFLFFLSAALGA